MMNNIDANLIKNVTIGDCVVVNVPDKNVGDLISRQAAIDAVADLYWMDERLLNFKKEIDATFDKIKALPSAQPEQRWVPCSERLPEDYQDVLVWFEYYRYGSYNRMYSTHGIGTYSKRYDSWMINHESGWKDLHVIAWMPLPEPYKGGEQDE